MSDPFIYNPVKIIITVLIAFLPAIIYSIIIRYTEKFDREPWGSIFQAFLWGATLSVVVVIIIRGFFRIDILPNYSWTSDEFILRLIVICAITPIIAEIVKPFGLLFVRGDIMEAEDGLIYGAVIGCGYTATENLMFGFYLAPLYGVDIFITVVFVRTMSVMFVHSSATALTCYGVSRAMKVKHKAGGFLAFPLFLGAAILIHAGYNYFAYMDMFNVGQVNILVTVSTSVLFSIIFALLLMFLIYFKIHRLDSEDKRKEEEARKAQEKRDMEFGGDSYPRPRSRKRPAPRRRERPSPRAQYDDYYDQGYPERYDYGPPLPGPGRARARPRSAPAPASRYQNNNYPSQPPPASLQPTPRTNPRMPTQQQPVAARPRPPRTMAQPEPRPRSMSVPRPPGFKVRSQQVQAQPQPQQLQQTQEPQKTQQRSDVQPSGKIKKQQIQKSSPKSKPKKEIPKPVKKEPKGKHKIPKKDVDKEKKKEKVKKKRPFRSETTEKDKLDSEESKETQGPVPGTVPDKNSKPWKPKPIIVGKADDTEDEQEPDIDEDSEDELDIDWE
jgi:RsiW-degrading membrane proteinase PrsW (M82 family)